MMTNLWITPMVYDKWYVFVAGMLPFLLNLVVLGTSLSDSIFHYLGPKDSIAAEYALIYVFWQSLVGGIFVHGLYHPRAQALVAPRATETLD